MQVLSILPIVMGLCIASQTAINSRLTHYDHFPMLTSAVSFGVGSVFLAIITIASGKSLSFSISIIPNHPWWIWLGGFTAAFALTSNILLFKHLGSIEATLYPIVGQIFMSLFIDQFGWFNSLKQPMNLAKTAGAILLIAGLLIFINLLVFIQTMKKNNVKQKNPLPWQLLGIAAGALLAIQNAVNAKLGSILQSPVHASFISFLISFIILLIINKAQRVHFASALNQVIQQEPRSEWWIWIGGILGSSYVALSSVLVPFLGTGQVVIIALFGQLIFSALIQQFGWFKSQVIRITRPQIIGTIVMFIGILLIKFG